MAFQRIAAIDIGTVTCRLLVAETDGVALREVARQSNITNLGEGVDATGVLKPEAMQRVFDTVAGFLSTIRDLDAKDPAQSGPSRIIAMATSASRDASNAADFVAGLAALGVSLSVIPGSKEAALSFLGAGRDFLGKPILVSDIGGGSTEIIAGIAGQEPLFAHSFNIGCRRVTERFFAHDPQTQEEANTARLWIREQFDPFFQQMLNAGFVPEHVVSVAGTATSVVSIRDCMEVYDSARVHGAFVSGDELDSVYNQLASLPLEQRMQVVGLQPQRAAVINAGTVILQEVLRAAQCNGFVASESDILHGIVLTAAM